MFVSTILVTSGVSVIPSILIGSDVQLKAGRVIIIQSEFFLLIQLSRLQFCLILKSFDPILIPWILFFCRISVAARNSAHKMNNSLTPDRCGADFKSIISKQMIRIKLVGISCELTLRWMPQNVVVLNQHYFRSWLGAVRQQAITWVSVDPDLCRHIGSLGHNE